MAFEDTKLWESFKIGGEGAKKLIESYFDFRGKAAQLTSLIPKTLVDLTVHDISHLDGLWSTASLLAGDRFKMNPLEIYIFGGAVLLHDSALCAEAYEGIEALRQTAIWQDSYQILLERGHINIEQIEKLCDFQAVRKLHAEQAEKLATKTWTIESTGEHVSLISDDSLRNAYGQLIGKIAASHHWDLVDLQTRLPKIVGAIENYPANWTINPVKIACLLRCADALHVSKVRAPDFLHALTKRIGISHSHWQAQNWLAQAAVLSSDPSGETAVISSTKPFDSENDRAWWVAYDLVVIANREICACNELLGSNSYPDCETFQIKKIAGSGSAVDLVSYIPTQGWQPSPIELKVSDIKGLVDSLGGQSLYGSADFQSQLLVVLRELIQNARDAINARSKIEADAPREILVRLTENPDSFELSISDTGCGMSKSVLTGPLLDFGASFWTSDLVHIEFPGLKAGGFRSSGKFGIGFYSSFMVADSISVTTRSYKDGLEKSNQLVFKEGLSLRPMLIVGKNLASMKYTTEIKLGIKKNRDLVNFDFQFGTSYLGIPSETVGLKEALSHLAYFGGVEITLQECTGLNEKILTGHEPNLYLYGASELGNSKHPSRRNLTEGQRELLTRNLREIVPGDSSFGVASLNPFIMHNNGYGAKTIGGLRTNLQDGTSSFFGFIEHFPDSAKRNPGDIRASNSQIRAWVEEQLNLLDGNIPNPIDRCILGTRLTEFGYDPIRKLVLPVVKGGEVYEFLDIDQVAELVISEGLYVFTDAAIGLVAEERDARKIGLYPRFSDVFGNYRIFFPISVPPHSDKKTEDYSVNNCLYRILYSKGYILRNYKEKTDFVSTMFSTKIDSNYLTAEPLE